MIKSIWDYGMQPVAAVILIFALVFSGLCWLRLLQVSFQQHTLLGLLALFVPPLALIFLWPLRKQEQGMFVLALAALFLLSIFRFF